MQHYLGLAVLALPFLIVFSLSVRELGWKDALCLWAALATGVGCIVLGTWLTKL